MTPRPGKAFRLSFLELEPRTVPSATASADPVAPGGAPNVVVRDAAGAVVATIAAYEPTMTAGVRVAVYDLTGDGVPEVVTAPMAGGGPRVRVFDGATFASTADFYAYEPTFLGGVSVAAGPIGRGGVGIATGAGAGGSPRVRTFTPAGTEVANFFAGDQSARVGVDVVLKPGAGGRPVLVATVGVDAATFDPRTGTKIVEVQPGPVDLNRDGVPDGRVLDKDGDGVADPSGLVGNCHGGGVAVDLDGDGQSDGGGFDLDNDGAVDAVGLDTDGDGKLDGLDTDGDGRVDASLPACGGGGVAWPGRVNRST